MRIYKIAHQSLMDKATNILAKKLLDMIKHLYEANQLFAKKHREISTNLKYEGFELPIQANISLDIFDNAINPPFKIEALYSSKQLPTWILIVDKNAKSEDRNINISISIASNFSQKNYNDFYNDGVGVLRHELEHMIQDQEKMFMLNQMDYNPNLLREKDPVKRFSEVSRYMTSKFEQEPFIRGFMQLCKKQRKPLILELQKFIHNQLFTPDRRIEEAIRRQYGLQAEHIEQILINLYIQRAKKIFPNIA